MSSTVLKPMLSEKAYALSESGVYVFIVPKNTNSLQVAKAVSKQFSVNVNRVRLSASAAKSRRSYKKRGRSIDVSTSGLRKAYVTLNEGENLPFFTSDEPAKKSKKESK